MKKVLQYLGHFLAVSAILFVIVMIIGLSEHATAVYHTDKLSMKMHGEGPFVFLSDQNITSHTIKGSREEGFRVEKHKYPSVGPVPVTVTYVKDNSQFSFTAQVSVDTPPVRYNDAAPILAMSDLEGNYGTFRDFLLKHNVIADDLSWAFGSGHLVLVGDFVDRGYATTQLLWFIYKLEQEAREAGGQVHYLLGNHEIKNLQGNFTSAEDRYVAASGILGKTQADLYSDASLIGRWLASKNTLEVINGTLFVHGGIAPEITKLDLSLEDMNARIRAMYRQMYYPGVADEKTSTLISTRKGPAWYRGYFKGELTAQEVKAGISRIGANQAVVGHTLQFGVTTLYDGLVYAIDVKHPSAFEKTFPVKHSEGLWIENGHFYRATDTGKKERLNN